MITITVQAEVCVPLIPNFFLQPDGGKFPIEVVADEGLRKIGKSYTEGLIEKARQKRAIKANKE